MARKALTGNLMRKAILISLSGLLLSACNPHKRTPAVVELKDAPTFNEDSAYRFIEDQVDFGFRIPGTESHEACGDYLVSKLAGYGFDVSEQKDTILGFDKQQFPLRNIIASLNPNTEKRMLLCAHWDSRAFADQASENQEKPIVGANDNASGVGVALEIARLMGQNPPSIGIDIVLFDMEDQGRPADQTDADPNDHGYCLGSEYWCLNLDGPKQEFGILLDMVGATNAEFTLEGYSVEYAKEYTYMIWDLGNQLGYDNHFIYNRTHRVYDDHARVNYMAGIPCVDIIHQDVQNKMLFWDHWHTHNDNLDVIDKSTLKAVGQTVTQVVYNQ